MDTRRTDDPEKRNDALDAALAIFKRQPGYPAAQLNKIERNEQLDEIARKLPVPALPSPERLDYALKFLDNMASAYVDLVTDHEKYEAFQSYLWGVEMYAWTKYHGAIPIEGNKPPQEIRGRIRHWTKQALQRWSALGESTDVPITATMRRGYRAEVHKWMADNEIKTNREAARALAVSVDILKSIMSKKGKLRCSEETLSRVLAAIGLTGE